MGILNPTKICCVIITYNPNDNLLSTINIMGNQVGKIIIVDNDSEDQSLVTIANSMKKNAVCLLQNKQNEGIAKALNQGIRLAGEMGFDWVITFDQDTKPFNNIIATISEVYTLYPDKQKIGAIGANFSNANSGWHCHIKDQKKYCERDYLITSGCLLSMNAFYEIGGFREDFFIDNVDLEYSLRLKRYGKISLITKKSGMNHQVGNPKTKRFFGFNMVSSNHNSHRRYFMARNHIILSKEYLFKNPYFITKTNFFFILSLFQILLLENNRKTKILASLKGIINGFLYKRALELVEN